VLAGYDNTLTYQKLVEVCDYVRAGLPYIATHPDFNCPVEGGFEPDLGSFMALIEASTGRKADRVAGKPEVELILSAQKRLGAERNEIAMCGDRLYTDIAAGKKHGLLSILVLSGEAKEEDIPKAAYKPDIVVPKLSSLNAFL
jgi:HAD superfamily hydrolase (TIGR01450 family)